MVELNDVVDGGGAIYNELVQWNNEKAGAGKITKEKTGKKGKKGKK